MVLPRFFAAVCLLLGAASASHAAETLTAETSRPNMSTFAAGEKVLLKFSASGLTPASSTVLTIVTKDAHDAIVATATMPVNALGDGTWTGEYTPPEDKLGFYRVFPTLADGTTLPSLFTRNAGYLTYAIVPDPAKRTDYGRQDSMFGMQGGFSDSVNIIPYLGVRWVLGPGSWSDLEPNHAGQFAEEAAAAKSKGQVFPARTFLETLTYNGKPWNMYLLPSLNGAPDWAIDPAMKTANEPILPSAEKAYQAYCEAFAKAYASSHPNENFHLYQVTWEPVYPWGFKGTNKQLVRIYELAYPALHKGDPNAVVLGPTDAGIGGNDAPWTDALFTLGLGKYIDGLSIHPYFNLPPDSNGLIKAIQDLKDVIRKHLGHDIPLYGSEQGYATKNDVSKEILQAQGLVREYLIMAGEGFRFNFAFYIADFPGEPGYGLYYNLHPGMDFGTDKIGPKPIAPAYAAMTWLIDGHRPTQRIDWLSPTTLGYAFDRNGDVVLSLWDFGDKPRQVSIPVGVDRVTVYDWMGNASQIATPGGALETTLTGDPIYIKGVAASLWGRNAVKLLHAAQRGYKSFPGTSLALAAEVSAPSEAINGTVTVQLDPRFNQAAIVKPVNVARGGKFTVQFNAQIPADADLGIYSAMLVLKNKAGRTLAGDGVRVEVVPPVAIESVSPIAAGSGNGLQISLSNAQSNPVAGGITTRLEGVPGSKQEMPFDLTSQEQKIVAMPALDADISPSRVYHAIVQVHTKAGYEFTQTFSVDFLQAPRLSVPMAIDGNLNNWTSIPGVALAGREAVVRSPQFWTGNADLSATVKYAWDDNALYLAVDAEDDVFVQDNTGFDTWKGDGLQIGIDVDNGKEILTTGNTLADSQSQHRWSEMTMALTKNGPQVYRTGSYNPSLFPVAQVPASDISLSVVRQGVHTLYEAAIPWRMLGKNEAPKAGDRIGVALSVNDMDDPKQTEPKAVGLFGGMNGHKEMGDYGVLTLGGH